jgi:hypothetical protein
MSRIASVFKPTVAMPPPPPPPPSPTSTDPAAAADAARKLEDAAAAERKVKGRAATLLTGGAGVGDEAPVSKRVLLGS